MYICLCRAITQKAIEQAILAGAHSLEEVTAQTKAGSCCGGCRPNIEELLEKTAPCRMDDSTASCCMTCRRPEKILPAAS